MSRWREWRSLVAFVATMLVFRSMIADWNQVPSGSMLPSILIGDRIVVDKLAYDLRAPFTRWRLARLHDPARGDVVTFVSPEDGRLLVKRVVGSPGDLVAMTDNRLAINGEPAAYAALGDTGGATPPVAGYQYLRETILGSQRKVMVRDDNGDPRVRSFAPIRVPAGEYLMLGDNRDNSRDSRVIGFIGRDRITGRATAIAFSLDYENHYAPRLDRFLANLQ